MWYSHSLKAVCRVSGGFSFQSFSSHSISSHFEKTGAFRHRIPDILEAPTHYRRALKGLKEVKRDEKIANKSQRNRKFIVQSIDKLMVGLTAPLTDIIKTFRSCMASLHPYEKVVTNLILNTLSKEKKTSLKETLSDVKKLRAQTSKISKQFAAEAKLAKNTDQAERIFYSLKTSLQQLYDVESSASIVDSKKSSNIGILTDVQKTDNCDTHCSKCLIELQKILQELRKVPVIEFSSPSVVLVGSPNVGKSTLVRSLSSGTPEVADYPFTTRGVSVGHIIYDDTRIQVMDTPGLLDRPVEARNDMEKLTFASMAYVPSVVIFVIDPTGLSGQKSTLEMQLNIRSGLRKQFPVRPWIDVITKSDIFVADETLSLLPPDALFVSPKTGQGMNALGQKLLEGTRELKTLLEARKNDGFSNHLPNKDCIDD